MATTKITGTGLGLPTADGNALGGTSNEFSDLYLADGSVIYFGADQDVSLTHVADTGVLLNSTMKIQFNDASQFIHGSSATVLSIGATDEVDITATLVDINANVEISGTATTTGVHTFSAVPVLPANSIDSAHYVDGSIDLAHMSSQSVDEDNLYISNSPTNGYMLTAQSGNAGGLTWAAAGGGGASDIDGLSDALVENNSIWLGNDPSSTTDTASNNVAVGTTALDSITTADHNTALGHDALTATTSGGRNSAIGKGALAANTTGSSNVAMGYGALGANTTAAGNTGVGRGALGANTTGSSNTGVGYLALEENITGNFNVGIGTEALAKNTEGDNNTAFGYNAGNLTTTGDNNITLGYNADPSANDASNEVTLGDSSISAIRCQVQSISSLSDRRDKKSIKELPVGLDFINDLKPVKFVWDMRDGAKKGIQEIGFIAQDLDESQINADAEDYLNLVLKNNPDKLEASYGKLVPILVKAVQELSAEVNHLKEKLNT